MLLMKNINIAFYVVPLGLFLIVASPNLFTDGMFMDGVIYATVARNMAMDIGSFWVPKLSETFFLKFYEYPPLALGLESLFFRGFGDHFWVERLYSFSTYLVTSGIMIFMWRNLVIERYRSLSWLPLLLILPLPIISWSASNNLVENTMLVFSSLSILFLVKSLRKKRFQNLLVGAFWLLAAFFCKGPVALFPQAFFFWVLIFKSDYSFRRFAEDTVVLGFLSLCLLAMVLIVFPDSTAFLQEYYQHQIVNSFENVVMVSSRFYILERLILEFLPALLIASLIGLFVKKVDKENRMNSWAYIFLGVGLSAVLPIMVSLRQRGFYILPALPILALALALLIAPKTEILVTRLTANKFGRFLIPVLAGVLLLIGVILNVSNFGEVGRDENTLSDVHTLSEILPGGTVLRTSTELNGDYSLKAYLYRDGFLSLSIKDDLESDFLLLAKEDKPLVSSDFKLVTDSLRLYQLYSRVLTN